MKTVYLRDGEEVRLHQEIDKDNFIIERLVTFYNYEGNEDTDLSGVKEIVSQIFIKPPVSKKQDEFLELLEKIKTKNEELASIEKQLYAAKNDLRKIDEMKTNAEDLIVNRKYLKDAKTITIFDDNGYLPKTLNENKKSDYRVSICFNIIDGSQNLPKNGLNHLLNSIIILSNCKLKQINEFNIN